jgi:uncharacterized protein (TIGR03437 family)
MYRRVSHFVLLSVLGFVARSPAFAEPPIVFGAFSVAGVDVLSPGLVVEIAGSWLNRDAVVEVDGKRATVLDYRNAWGEEYLVVQTPFDLAPGTGKLVVTTAAGASKPHPVTMDLFTPGLLNDLVRAGGPVVSWDCRASTVSRGEVLTARAVGLGTTTPGSSSTSAMPEILIGGEPTEVLSFAFGPRPGEYEVRFRAPASDGLHEVVLAIAGRRSSPKALAVGKTLWHWSPPPTVEAIAAADLAITVSPCGGTFAAVALPADPRQPPTSLAGVTVEIRDSAGVTRLSRLLYVSPSQINYVVPSGIATGKADVKIVSSAGTIFSGALDIQRTAPRLFTVGLQPLAMVMRVRDGVQTIEPTIQMTPMGIVSLPIDLGPETDQVFLLLFGTGLRYASTVTVLLGGVDAPVEYAGAQSEFAGLDQVNVRLPRSLTRNTQLPVELSADGRRANITHLQFQ